VARCQSTFNPASVACSCDSFAVRSGLSTRQYLALGHRVAGMHLERDGAQALAYSVGLTAATTWPSAATSRTKLPRSTVAIDNRERSTDMPAPE
jgi:hypothetical protein